MKKIINWRRIFNFCLPYLIMIICSLASTYVFFFPGLPSGDDLYFHMGMIEDVYLGFLDGQFGLSTNHFYFGGFALDTFGFYGPFSHHFAAILLYCFSWTGATAITVYKFCIFASAFVGGVFAYYLGRKMSKNELVGIIAGVAFIFMPYRIFCALCRAAFSETIAMALIPLVFYGLYSIFNDEKFSINPYLSLAVGAIILVLCHPFTALLTATIALVYIACNIKKLFKKRVGFNIWPFIGGTVLVIFMGVAFSFINTLNTIGSGLFRVSDEVITWTNLQYVSGTTRDSIFYSGLLNIIWLNSSSGSGTWIDENVSFILFGIILYFASMCFVAIIDACFKRLPHNKWYRYPSMVIIAFILPLVTRQRVEVYIAIAISLLIYIFISYASDKAATKEDNKDKHFPLNEVIFLCVSLVFTLTLLFSPDIWSIMPKIYRQCQFAWRCWTMISFLLPYLIIVLLKQLNNKKHVLLTASIISVSLITLSMGLIEKRAFYQLNKQPIVQVDQAFVSEMVYSGAMNEMVPMVFYENTYNSEYTNSLYSRVSNAVRFGVDFIRDESDYYQPVFLEGDGTVAITEMKTPTATFEVVVTSDTTLVQFPQFYQDGYYANFADKKVEAQNIDGLIAFNLEKGNYTMKLSFERFKGYSFLATLFYVSLVFLVGSGVFGIWYRKRLYGLKLVTKEQIQSE